MPERNARLAIADRIQQFAHAFLADVEAAVGVLRGGIVCEQIGHAIPVRAVQVIAVDALQALDLVDIVQERSGALQGGNIGYKCRGGGAGLRSCQQRDA